MQEEVAVIVTLNLFVIFICLLTIIFELCVRPLRLLRSRVSVRGVLGDRLGRGVAFPWQQAWGVRIYISYLVEKLYLVLYMGNKTLIL